MRVCPVVSTRSAAPSIVLGVIATIAPISWLRAMQSGQAGNHVAWLTLGLAALGAGVIVALR